METYIISGLKVNSEFRLPNNDPVERVEINDADVTIEFRDDIGSPASPRFTNHWITSGSSDFVFKAFEGLTFRIRDGRLISISRAPYVSDQDVNLYLIGSAWGVLCHQRGLLPLHCSAVEFSGRAYAFTGPSGHGKSTLGAGLAKRNYLHLCDDTCVIDPADVDLRVHPMPKGMKLMGDAVDALGLKRGAAVSASASYNKYHVALPDGRPHGSPSIAAIFVLVWSAGPGISITPLLGGARFDSLMNAIYRVEWLNLLRDRAEIFEQVGRLAQRTKIFEFRRSKDASQFDAGLDELERFMTKIAGEEIV